MTILDKVYAKLGLDPVLMNNMRRATIYQQRKLQESLDKEITILIPEGQRLDPNEESLTFKAAAWTEVHQVVKSVKSQISSTIGKAHGLLFDMEKDGFEGLTGMFHQGVTLDTIAVPLWRVMHLLHGVMKITQCSEYIQRQINEQVLDKVPIEDLLKMTDEKRASIIKKNDNKIFTHDKIIIPAGERLHYEFLHRTYFSTQFLPSTIEEFTAMEQFLGTLPYEHSS